MENDRVKLKIITGDDNSILRTKAKEIDGVTSEIHDLIEKMAQKMKKADGIGLAAPQTGKSIQLFLVDSLAFDRGRSKWEFKKIEPPDVTKSFAFINPSIASYPKGQEEMTEGCLSLPGWEGSVKRSKRITIKAQTSEGKTFKLQAKGLLARVLQHEYDHLQGILICDKWQKKRKTQNAKRKTTIQKSKVRGIVFFGDSEFSQVVLNELRGTVYEPEIIIGKTTNYQLLTTNYSLGITAAYGKIIPPSVIKKFSHGILNIHPSLLPRYRGPSPVQQTILNGDRLTGVSVILLIPKLDSGDILAQQEFVIDKAYTTSQLQPILFTMGANLLVDVIPQWLGGSLTAKKQDESGATYTPLLKKEDGLIDWSQSAVDIERKIRAYQPWPIAYTFFSHRGKVLRVQILEAIVQNLTEKNQHGRLDRERKEPIVYCGKGSLVITKLRPEGKKEISGEEFIRGYETEKFFRQSA